MLSFTLHIFHAQREPRMLAFYANTTSTWLEIGGLEPATTYTIDIAMQFANTINKDIWSDESTQRLSTLASTHPARAQARQVGGEREELKPRSKIGVWDTI